MKPGEASADALARELAEETGLVLVDAGHLAYRHEAVGPDETSYVVAVWEVSAWSGELAPADPDGFVLEAAWVPLGEAIRRLEQVDWLAALASHLRGA